MAQLAIKGHATRGKEVIEILEMLGGKNDNRCCGSRVDHVYLINENGYIEGLYDVLVTHFLQISLEQFLEKFPYRIGDKVIIKSKHIYEINEMMWDGEEVKYSLTDKKVNSFWYSIDDLQPYTEQKEENMKETKKDLDCHPIDYLEFVDNNDTWADEVELNLGDSYEIQVRDGKTFAVKKQPQYPKTYKACCDVLGLDTMDNDAKGYKAYSIIRFQELLIARDAYWKLAGEQMGLGGSWEPNWDKLSAEREFIKIKKGCFTYSSRILVFPTAEMRDAFYENFKDLIELCKELL